MEHPAKSKDLAKTDEQEGHRFKDHWFELILSYLWFEALSMEGSMSSREEKKHFNTGLFLHVAYDVHAHNLNDGSKIVS